MQAGSGNGRQPPGPGARGFPSSAGTGPPSSVPSAPRSSGGVGAPPPSVSSYVGYSTPGLAPPQAAPSSGGGFSDTGLEHVMPRQFGKYTLLKALAKGGMAEVYLALQRSVAGFEKLVVIKRILPELSRDQAFVEMLLHEARVAATLSHPNIVQTFDVGEVEGTYFIAMEHIHGEDIRAVVRAMRRVGLTDFPLEHALSIVLGVCAGLAYAHERRDLEGRPMQIVHRDISPQNILLTFDGDVKVVDFGIAKSVEVARAERSNTRSGGLKGKVPYMSPEQAAGQPIDHRSDIFSTGVVLFELSTGRRLFKAKTEYDTLKLICEREYPRPSRVRPDYPESLELIVMKALSRDISRRYQSARELQSDLENFIRAERIAASTVHLGNWMKMLFEDKIAEQKEALQDAKQLADVLAAQYSEPDRASMYGMASISGTGPGTSSGTSPGTSPGTGSGVHTTAAATFDATGSAVGLQPHKASSPLVRWLLVGGVVLAVGGGGGYLVVSGALSQGSDDVASAMTTVEPDPTDGPALVQKGKLEITTEPKGCDVWINGELQKSVTPTTLENLPLGRAIDVKLSKQGFESYREKMTFEAEELARKIHIKMTKGSVTVVLEVRPEPTVYIDGKKWEGEGNRIEGLSAGRHKLVVTAPGHVPQTFFVEAEKGATKVIEASLVKGGAKPSADAQVATTAAPVDEKPQGDGKVNVSARPGYCADVRVNGRSVGPTPVGGIVVPAGPVSVVCKTTSGGTLSGGASVEPGKTARVFFNVPK